MEPGPGGWPCQTVAAALVHGLDIRIETSGPIPDHGALVVSNHRSYLDIVVVFPEGTTTAGPGLLPFKNGIFHLACKKDIPVVPVAVSYENPKAAWIGDDFFLPHFLEIFKTSPLKARLSFGPEIREENGDILKATAHSSIQHQLHAMQSAPSSIQLPAIKNLRPCGP